MQCKCCHRMGLNFNFKYPLIANCEFFIDKHVYNNTVQCWPWLLPPRCMRYRDDCSTWFVRLSVYLSATTLAATYIVCTSKMQCHQYAQRGRNILTTWGYSYNMGIFLYRQISTWWTKQLVDLSRHYKASAKVNQPRTSWRNYTWYRIHRFESFSITGYV